MKKFVSGNLDNIIKERGNSWVLGHFMPQDSPLNTSDLEIKWSVHKAGESKYSTAVNKSAKTIAVLVSGKVLFRLPSEKKEIVLSKQGDYLFLNPGVSHDWKIIEDSVVITVRWPSIPNDQTQIKNT